MSNLIFYYGTMSASKTTQLIMASYSYGDGALIIKPSIDDRDGKKQGFDTIESRVLNSEQSCFYTEKIDSNIFEMAKNKQAVFVDEVQFFSINDVWMLSEIVDKLKKDVICYGLKTDSNGRVFPSAGELFAIADEVKEIERKCENQHCTHKATMHVRFLDGRPVIGDKTVSIEKGNVTYKSVCRECFKNIFERG